MRPGSAIALAAACALACAGGLPASRYRLAESEGRWTSAGDHPVLDDLRPRYPEYFGAVLDCEQAREPDLRPLRDDLERSPVDRRNYDALNAVAIGYFEMNARAEERRGSGSSSYLAGSFQVARLAGVPWRAYREIEAPDLREAILDFFADAASGSKPASARTASRLGSIVRSLEQHETDTGRLARIRSIAGSLAVQAGGADAPF